MEGAFDAGVVVLDDLLQGPEATVVHVGRGEGEIAQGGDFEFAAIVGIAGDKFASQVLGVVLESVVVKSVVAEEGAAVAVEAIRAFESVGWIMLGDEELETALFLFGELDFASHRLVKARFLRDEREEVLLERFGKKVRGDFFGGKDGLELCGVVFVVVDASDCFLEGESQFVGMLDGVENLFPQGGRASVPEHFLVPGEIEKRHRVAGAFSAKVSGGKGFAGIGEGGLGLMAASTGEVSVVGEGGIEKEALAEGDSFGGEGIVGGVGGPGEVDSGRGVARRKLGLSPGPRSRSGGEKDRSESRLPRSCLRSPWTSGWRRGLRCGNGWKWSR